MLSTLKVASFFILAATLVSTVVFGLLLVFPNEITRGRVVSSGFTPAHSETTYEWDINLELLLPRTEHVSDCRWVVFSDGEESRKVEVSNYTYSSVKRGDLVYFERGILKGQR